MAISNIAAPDLTSDTADRSDGANRGGQLRRRVLADLPGGWTSSSSRLEDCSSAESRDAAAGVGECAQPPGT